VSSITELGQLAATYHNIKGPLDYVLIDKFTNIVKHQLSADKYTWNSKLVKQLRSNGCTRFIDYLKKTKPKPYQLPRSNSNIRFWFLKLLTIPITQPCTPLSVCEVLYYLGMVNGCVTDMRWLVDVFGIMVQNVYRGLKLYNLNSYINDDDIESFKVFYELIDQTVKVVKDDLYKAL
jgi:hypothetical protein